MCSICCQFVVLLMFSVTCLARDGLCLISFHRFFPLFSHLIPGDAYYLAIGGGVAEHNWNHIRTVLQDQGFRCQLTDHSEDMGMISIQGPKRWGKEKKRKGGGKERVNEWKHCYDLWIQVRKGQKAKRGGEGNWLSWRWVMIHILDMGGGEKWKEELLDQYEESRLSGSSQRLGCRCKRCRGRGELKTADRQREVQD